MTELVRDDLREALRTAKSAHPGLLLQRGWQKFVKTDSENAGAGGKTEHIRPICAIPASEVYKNAYARWRNATTDSKRFLQFAMKIDGRLLIGLTGGGALETGCAVSHTHGMPYLPGSSIKGVVRAWAERAVPAQHKTQLDDIFGKTDSELSGLVAFHDAWWIPGSAPGADTNKPFVEEIVTPHHADYYSSDGKTPASDLDSPIPNAMIGVHGSFLFVIEGDPAWLKPVSAMLSKALAEHGIGAKTRAGYGYLGLDTKENVAIEHDTKKKIEAISLANLTHEQRAIQELRNRFEQDKAWKGKGLGNPLGERLRNFVDQAEKWDGEMRDDARKFLEDALIHLSVDRKKNDKAKTLWRRLADTAAS